LRPTKSGAQIYLSPLISRKSTSSKKTTFNK
jgi:hypothetical protein